MSNSSESKPPRPQRPLPKQPSLEFDRKQAKRLIQGARRAEPAALERLREHPRWARLAPEAASAARLSDAQFVLARGYGFASWRAWKRFVEAQALARAERAQLVLGALCSNEFRQGQALLAADPELGRFDVFCAAACGELEHLRQLLARRPELARESGGPLACPAIVYACFSRFLRRDETRAAQIVLVVRDLLAGGADANAHFYEGEGRAKVGQTCLYAASGIANNAELSELLLAAGADIDERVPEPAHEALYHAAEFRDTRCLELLLRAKPEPSFVSYCLSRALDFDNERAALLFLEHGADPNHQVAWHNQQGHLHKAVIQRRSPRTIAALLAHGASPNLKDARGLSPYRYAVRLGYADSAALLEAHGAERSQVTPEDRAGLPDPQQLEWAARRNDLVLIERLLAAGAAIDGGGDMPPLHAACVAGQLEAVALLIERGANLTLKNRYGGDAIGSTIWGSLNCADVEGGPATVLPEEIVHGRWGEVTELLLRAGAPPPAEVNDGSDAVQDALRRLGVPEERDDTD
jgi:ankyrin repeat protein